MKQPSHHQFVAAVFNRKTIVSTVNAYHIVYGSVDADSSNRKEVIRSVSEIKEDAPVITQGIGAAE